MKDRQWQDDGDVQQAIIRTIAHDLKAAYAIDTQLPPWLQALLQRFDELLNETDKPPTEASRGAKVAQRTSRSH